MVPSGYSGTPLARKLGIKNGYSMHLVNEPVYYFELFSDIPAGVKRDGSLISESKDFIQVFVRFKSELIKWVPEVIPLMKKNGMLWVSWPKGRSTLITDINRESVREFVLSAGLVDIKVCSVDKDWSALKFVYRIEDR